MTSFITYCMPSDFKHEILNFYPTSANSYNMKYFNMKSIVFACFGKYSDILCTHSFSFLCFGHESSEGTHHIIRRHCVLFAKLVASHKLTSVLWLCFYCHLQCIKPPGSFLNQMHFEF